MREHILRYLLNYPGATATKIADDLAYDRDSTASLLNKLVRADVLMRKKGLGPRKGYGYFLPYQSMPKHVRRCSAWERLMGPSPVNDD